MSHESDVRSIHTVVMAVSGSYRCDGSQHTMPLSWQPVDHTVVMAASGPCRCHGSQYMPQHTEHKSHIIKQPCKLSTRPTYREKRSFQPDSARARAKCEDNQAKTRTPHPKKRDFTDSRRPFLRIEANAPHDKRRPHRVLAHDLGEALGLDPVRDLPIDLGSVRALAVWVPAHDFGVLPDHMHVVQLREPREDHALKANTTQGK
jgi:hypothetical protein